MTRIRSSQSGRPVPQDKAGHLDSTPPPALRDALVSFDRAVASYLQHVYQVPAQRPRFGDAYPLPTAGERPTVATTKRQAFDKDGWLWAYPDE